MVLQKQIKLSDYYVKKNGNTISQDGNNVTAANKNVATDGSGNVIFEEKNNHNHDATYVKKTDIDSSLSSSSNNPVQNKVINTALNEKADSGHSHYINDLFTSLMDFPPIIDDGNNIYLCDMIRYTPDDGIYYYNGYDEISFEDFENTNNKSSNITTDTGSTTKYPTVKAVENYVNNKVDASFKVEVIQDYTVEDLENDYMDNNGEAFGVFLSNEGISYDANTIYLLANRWDTSSYYNEYVLIDDTQATPIFELLGTTQIDLSNYISKQSDNSNILLANGNTIAQSSFISKGSTADIQLANGSTTPTSSFATSGHSHAYIPTSAIKQTVTDGDTTGIPSGDAVYNMIDIVLDNIITQLRS